ncbi:MAG: AraC family transcriptional regulator [Leptospiraceae bacterium]|nr:AraC family transcriptional regulator [Leptospiraceae bacterium]
MYLDFISFLSLIITLAAAGLMILMALGQLMIRPLSKGRVMGAVLFVWVSIFLLNIGLGRRWMIGHLPYLYATQVPFYFLVGPLMKAYVKGLLSPRLVGPTYGKLQSTLALPGIRQLWLFSLIIIFYIPLVLMSGETKLAMLEQRTGSLYLSWYQFVLVWCGVFGLLSVTFAFLKLYFDLKIYQFFRKTEKSPTLWHLRILLLWIALMAVLGLFAIYNDELAVRRFVVSLVALGILWLYLLDFRYPGFFHQLEHQFRIQQSLERYSKSKIGNLDIAKTLTALEKVMVEQRMYADEELSLHKLAGILDIRPGQLSELLNSVLGVDFRKYLTDYRVAAARQMLLAEEDRSILAIAYSVGFNSKTSFNRNFKAIVGEPPAEFRARRLHQVKIKPELAS